MTWVTSSGEDISNIKTWELPPNLDAGERTEGARECSLISPASHITFTFNEACRARINTREMSIHAEVQNTEQPQETQEGKYHTYHMRTRLIKIKSLRLVVLPLWSIRVG